MKPFRTRLRPGLVAAVFTALAFGAGPAPGAPDGGSQQPAPQPAPPQRPQPVSPADLAPAPRTVPDDGLSSRGAPPPSVPVKQPPSPPDLAAIPPRDLRLHPIDLPYALGAVNASNPTIAVARARVDEAYARQQQAAVLWVPNAFVGGNPDSPAFLPTFYHHDGNVQNARGDVFEVTKSNLALQAGASLNLNLGEAFFAPRIARQATAAAAFRAQAVTFNVQLEVALAYLGMMHWYGAAAIDTEVIAKAEQMLQDAETAMRSGVSKTTADANRARTELEALRAERINFEAQAAYYSARLAQLLVLDPSLDLVPADRAVVPVALVNPDVAIDELIATGLLNRPELAESRALVREAVAAWRANQLRPLIPTLQVFYYDASFQGGTPGFHNTSNRDDLIAQAGWELRNGGLGDLFRAREGRARVSAANFHVLEVQAQVGAEVSAAAKQAADYARTLRSLQEAVRQAEEMWNRLTRLAFGLGGRSRQYDPLEALVALQQLHQARLAYLDGVIAFNENEFRLYWAMGQPPLCSLPGAKAVPVETPVVPLPAAPDRGAPGPGQGAAPQPAAPRP